MCTRCPGVKSLGTCHYWTLQSVVRMVEDRVYILVTFELVAGSVVMVGDKVEEAS